MKYAYELTYANGVKEWCIKTIAFPNKALLRAYEPKGVVAVRFHKHIPNGYHLCSCGNLVIGTNENELCYDCKCLYGHTYEDEL